MNIHVPFSDLATYDLRQHLVDSTIGPADMCSLATVFFADSDAVDVLCEHAASALNGERSFRLLVGLYAAQKHITSTLVAGDNYADQQRFRARIVSFVTAHVRDATETELLDGLDTARSEFSAGCARPSRIGVLYVSGLFADHAPTESLTDRVVAEMSVRFPGGLSPLFGLEARRPILRSRGSDLLIYHFVSMFLLSRFGTHGPSWDMFKHLCTVEASIGDVADLVDAVEQDI